MKDVGCCGEVGWVDVVAATSKRKFDSLAGRGRRIWKLDDELLDMESFSLLVR